MRRITNKIKNNKKTLLIISLIVIILTIIILLYSLNVFKTTPKKQTKTSNSKYAYYIPNGSGGYTRTNTRPNRELDYIKCNGEKLKKSKYTYNSSTGAFGISGITESTKCNLYFEPTFAQLLKQNNPPTAYTTVPGRAVSTTDEGLIEGPNDDYGAPTYYFRGTAPDNYVTFANKTWRVVRINGDGSVRLVLNTTTGRYSVWNTSYDTGNGLAYENETAVSYATYGNSTIKGVVESWYSTNIGNNTNYSSKVVTSKFCNDRELPAGAPPTGSALFFAPRTRLQVNRSPSMTCSTSSYVYDLNVGLLTADEVVFAGEVYGTTTNQSYYLHNSSSGSRYWWTLSPSTWFSTGEVSAFDVDDRNGWLLGTDLNESYLHYFRPVISLSSDISVTTASATNPGTSTNPYIVQ